MRCVLFASAALFLAALPANAASAPTGAAFLAMCVKNDSRCSFYVTGYLQALETAQVQPQGSKTGICFPANLTPEEAELAFIRFMKTHDDDPYIRDNPPENALWLAFSSAYPCK